MAIKNLGQNQGDPVVRFPNYEGLIIKLPENPGLKKMLEVKLAEYKTRLPSIDAKHKIAVLEKVLSGEEVNKYQLSQKLSLEKDFGFDEALFDNAFGVIADYVKNGGSGVAGGTGLKGES